MNDSQQLVLQIPAVALPLVAIAYLCIGEAWVQQRQQDTHKSVPRLRHAGMVTGWPVAFLWWCARWWWGKGRAAYARLRP